MAVQRCEKGNQESWKSSVSGDDFTGDGTGLTRGAAIGLAQAGHQVIAAVHLEEQVPELDQEIARLGLADRLAVKNLDLLDPSDRILQL